MSQHQAFRRAPVPAEVGQKLETITLAAPVRGIIMNENEAYMQPGAAIVLDNWAPTMRSLKLRGGCARWCVLPEATPVISMFKYASSNLQRMYAANSSKLYDVTTSTPVQIKTGQLSGNYVASQMSNASGNHMLVANEAGDYILHFDGTNWTTLNASQLTTDPAITPPPSCATGHNLTYVCTYRRRFFFIEGNSMNAWYLGIDSFQGVMKLVPLSGAAAKGGKLLFCATWSIDAGDGIDDKLVFVTNLGELLIFTGGDPGDSANWRQEGRYAMSPPLGMNAHLAIGGELLIATVDGIMPTSGAITKDRAELELAAITRTIKPMWRDEVDAKRQYPWTMHKWDEFGGIFVTLPGGTLGNQRCLVTNAATGAWCRFTGWDAMCFAQLNADMFFGTQTGIIMQADRTGHDDGVPYVATMVGGWEMFHSPSQTVTWRQARVAFSAVNGEPFKPQVSATTDYVVTLPQPPAAGIDPGPADVWDQGIWAPAMPGNYGTLCGTQSHPYVVGDRAYEHLDGYWDCTANHTSAASPSTFAQDRALPPAGRWTYVSPQPAPPVPTSGQRSQYAQWDQPSLSRPPILNTMWVSIGMTGFSHAPVVQVTVAQAARPRVELISIAATFEREGVNV